MARYTHFKVWLDGKIVDPEDAKLSVFTLTVLRGANVYEGLRAYWNPAKKNLYVWKLDEHLKRLGDSMKVMRMQRPYSIDDLRAAVVEWLRANDFHDDVHFRLVAYFGDGGSGGVKSYRPDEIDTGAFILGGPRPHDDKLERGGGSDARRRGRSHDGRRRHAGADHEDAAAPLLRGGTWRRSDVRHVVDACTTSRTRRSVVDRLACRGGVASRAIGGLLQHHLVQAERTRLERDGRARQVEPPRAVHAFADDPASLVGARLEPFDPLAARAGVVQAQPLDVEDLEARTLHFGQRLRQSGQIAVRKHIAGEALGMARRLPGERLRDPVIEVEPAGPLHLVDAREERRIVRDADVLDDTDRGDLVVARVGRKIAHIEILDATPRAEIERSDARRREVRLRARQRHAVRASPR